MILVQYSVEYMANKEQDEELNRFNITFEEALMNFARESNSLSERTYSRDTLQVPSQLQRNSETTFNKSLNIFKSYDIRGIYKLDINEEVAEGVGKSLATYIGKGKKICVASDYRKGSNELKEAFIEGVTSSGNDIVDLGTLPTPLFYFAVVKNKFDGGGMITASHNPAMWNGIKMSKKNAAPIAEGHGMEEIKRIFVEGSKISNKRGKLESSDNIVDMYYNYMLSKIKLGRKLTVVIDPGNGSWCGIAKELFIRLGCEVIEINGKPDANFPARGPDPHEFALDELKRKVVETNADFGVGFDADGDRASFIDEKGRYVGNGGILLPIFAKYYLKNHKNGKVVYDLTCSIAVEEVVKASGGVALINPTGHSPIITRMMEEKAILGGEYSNHLYFSDNSYLDDGCFNALKMAEMLSNTKQTLSEISNSIPRYPNVPEYNIDCPDEIKFEVIKQLQSKFKSLDFDKVLEIDGIKAFKQNGWVLIRASNTMPLIRVNSEGKDLRTAKKLFTAGKTLVTREITKRSKKLNNEVPVYDAFYK